MKKTLIALVILAATVLGGLFASRSAKPQPTANSGIESVPAPQKPNEEVSTPTVTVTAIPSGNPATILIPALDVVAKVELVGLDEQKRMDVPKDYNNVGWYMHGARPGEKGSSVVAGHYDSPSGSPAIFYYLDQLKAGDIITVSFSSGERVNFVVERTAIHKDDTFPIHEVFLTDDKPRLNLITCYGSWNANDRNYSDRLVAYSVLADP
jgi:LPXTG-site transpeptidase (sortase) family protein